LATVHSAAHWLKSLVEDEQERALLRRLLAPYESYLHARKQLRAEQGVEGPSGQPQTPWGPWTWQMLYSLSRAGDRAGAGATASRQLAERLHADDSHLMERLGVAARWADYLTRG
jgi:hypothetical protein